jgi:uncharacterized protein YggU (UPF0235/DUF167 family)
MKKMDVIVHPNSKRPRVDKDLLDTLHIYVNQPPLDNRANVAVTEALAAYLGIRTSKVTLIKGFKSKIKTFEISS